jgi:hypothetical protein
MKTIASVIREFEGLTRQLDSYTQAFQCGGKAGLARTNGGDRSAGCN